jgi:hypothetical protein
MAVTYYEKVVVTQSDEFPEYIGKTGVVLGISKDDSRVYDYALAFPGGHELVRFLPHQLQTTGEFADRRDFYDDNDRIRVVVRGGRGFLAE